MTSEATLIMTVWKESPDDFALRKFNGPFSTVFVVISAITDSGNMFTSITSVSRKAIVFFIAYFMWFPLFSKHSICQKAATAVSLSSTARQYYSVCSSSTNTSIRQYTTLFSSVTITSIFSWVSFGISCQVFLSGLYCHCMVYSRSLYPFRIALK